MFSIIKSGMDTAMQELSMISNNISNSNSIGYKKSSVSFSEFYIGRTVGSVERALVGNGANAEHTRRSDAQGALIEMGGALDTAIVGNGYFMIERPADADAEVELAEGELGFQVTRNGAFSLDSEGFLVSPSKVSVSVIVMPMAHKRKNILLIVPHMPAFDSCVPLMIRLHKRGKVDVKIIISHRLIKIDSRVEQTLKASGVPYVVKSLFGVELFSCLQIARSDFILTHSDPVAYGGKFRPRDNFIKMLKKNVVFIQHGMVQQGLHTQGVLRDVWDYYSQTLLIWADLPNTATNFLAPSVANRLHVTGITKTNLLDAWPNQDRLAGEFSKFFRRVLICHNFGFESERYSDHMFEKALKVWKAAAQSRPDIAFILRSHRGKRRRDIEQKIAKVCKDCPNIIRSERHYGIMAMATINDVMALVDCVISHPSTTILDAVYEGKPVAVMNSFQRIFECLPNVDTLNAFTKFIENDSDRTQNRTLRKTYGNVSDNLDKAAKIVEQQMNKTRI